MANGITNLSMTQQPDYAIEASDIERRRKLAELLQARGAEPSGATEVIGGWAIPKSAWEGVGKAAQQVSGAYQQNQLTERQRKLGEKMAEDTKVGDERLMAAYAGNTNLAQDPTKLAAALPQWMTDAQPDLMQKPASKADQKALLLGALLTHPDPATRASGRAAMLKAASDNPESAFAKIDPSKFTAGSITQFARTGNHADLVPRDKLEFQNVGGSLVGLNPYAGDVKSTMATSIRPDTAAELAQKDKQWSGLSGYQQQELPIQRANLGVAQGNLGVNRTNSFFNTGMAGMGGGGSPAIPSVGAQTPTGAQPMPQGAPQGVPPQRGMPPQAQVPQMVPNDGLTPKLRAEIAGDNAKTNNSNARDATSILNLSKGAESLIDKAHGSSVGNAIGGAQNFVGMESTKNQADAQLTALSGALVSKQPKMSGPQSDKDVLLYKQMAGDIGNATLPAGVRKAALAKVRDIAETYKNGYSANGYQGSGGASGEWDGTNRRSSSGVTRYDANGNAVR